MIPEYVKKHILEVEGGVANHPADRGGLTNMGITAATLARAVKLDPSLPTSVLELTEDQAWSVYERMFWVPSRASDMPPGVNLAHMDAAVHHGPARAAHRLQMAMGVPPGLAIRVVSDARIGRIQSMSRSVLIDAMMKERRGYFDRIVENNPSQSVFLKGWRNRLIKVKRNAMLALLKE